MELTQELPLAASVERARSSDWVPLLVAGIIFATLSAFCAVTSEGFLEADACTHYVYARFAISEPHFFVNVWGRPLVTSLYAVPAAFTGRIGVRLTSLVLALICGWAAFRVARLQNYRWPALAAMFTFAQPLVFLHSFSEMTELPFAAVIILAFWAYRQRQFWLMAILIGISPLGRPEGFGFIGLAAAALVLHRRWYWLPLLAIPLIGWNHMGWVLYGRPGAWWRWLPDNWPYAAESLYRSGNLFHFVALLPVVTSPLLFPAMLVGIWRSLRHPNEKTETDLVTDPARDAAPFGPSRLPVIGVLFSGDHIARCQSLIAILPLLILVGHSVLYFFGKMASNGELRYMLVVAPFWGLLSARGWEWIFEHFRWRHVFRWAAVAVLLPALLNTRERIGPVPVGFKVLPHAFSDDWLQARAIADWYRQWPGKEEYPMLAVSHPGLFYFLDVSPTGRDRAQEWHEKVLLGSPPRGTLLIWDSIYGVYNADTARSITDDELRAAGWRELQQFDPSGDVKKWAVFLSPDPAGGAGGHSKLE